MGVIAKALKKKLVANGLIPGSRKFLRLLYRR